MSPSINYSMAIPADVLIVDDMPINLQLLAAYLKAAGHNVRAVPRGDLALSAVASAKPDIILLDVMMPRMSGYEVAEHLQADPTTADIPIVFISGLSDEGFKKQAFHRGAVDYIVKPFKRDDVLSAVKKHVEASRHKQQPSPEGDSPQQPDLPTSSYPPANTTTTAVHSSAAHTTTVAASTSTSQDVSPKVHARDHLDTFLAQAWQHALTQTTPLALMLISIDDKAAEGKDIDDKANDSVNPKLLQHVIRLIQENLASDAKIYHYDAHSFAVILANTSLATTLTAAERLRSSISAYNWAQYFVSHLTVSIGVANSETLISNEVQPSNMPSNMPSTHDMHQHILQVAKIQLQRAQTRGGNEVCASGI